MLKYHIRENKYIEKINRYSTFSDCSVWRKLQYLVHPNSFSSICCFEYHLFRMKDLPDLFGFSRINLPFLLAFFFKLGRVFIFCQTSSNSSPFLSKKKTAWKSYFPFWMILYNVYFQRIQTISILWRFHEFFKI